MSISKEFYSNNLCKTLGGTRMFIFLLILWIVFNGKFTIEILLIGIVICALIYMFCYKFLSYSIKDEFLMIKRIPLMTKFFLVLIKEIFIANLVTIRFIITNRKISPLICHFTVDLKSEMLRVLLSHSITLTPGTITVELKDNYYVVHCLDKSFAQGIESSKLVQILKEIDEKG